MTYQSDSIDLPPSFYDCPGWCPEKKEQAFDYCETCPVGHNEREMKSEIEGLLDERVGPRWKDYGLDGLLRTIYEVGYIATQDPKEWTVTTARLVGIYKAEQSRQERVRDYNQRQAMKSKRTRNG